MRKAFICPAKYVQGEDEILNLGYFVHTYGQKVQMHHLHLPNCAIKCCWRMVKRRRKHVIVML